MNDDREVPLLKLSRGDRGELWIFRALFQGKAFTKVQLRYPGEGGELLPGRQCVTFRDHELNDVIDVLIKVRKKIQEAGS